MKGGSYIFLKGSIRGSELDLLRGQDPSLQNTTAFITSYDEIVPR